MEGMPVRFYCYRHLNYWEAELPIGWNALAIGTLLSFSSDSGTGPMFTVTTFDREHWESRRLKELETPIRKSWSEVVEQYAFLPEDAFERKPRFDQEVWNEDMQELWHSRNWLFRGQDFVILILQTCRAKDKNEIYDSIVDRFVATVDLVRG